MGTYSRVSISQSGPRRGSGTGDAEPVGGDSSTPGADSMLLDAPTPASRRRGGGGSGLDREEGGEGGRLGLGLGEDEEDDEAWRDGVEVEEDGDDDDDDVDHDRDDDLDYGDEGEEREGGKEDEEAPRSLWPNPEEAAAMLAKYKGHKAALYPFVVIPPHLGEEDLRTRRPFLWKAVMMIERVLDGTGQITMAMELLGDISRAAFIQPDKSLDVLMSLQLVIAWMHYSINGFQLTNMLFLCRSLCIGLRIVKDTGQYPGDELLVNLVRIQKLAQTIAFTVGVDNKSTLASMQLPLIMVVQSFQEQLDAFKASLPPHLREDPAIVCRTAIAQVLLYEVAVTDAMSASAGSTTGGSGVGGGSGTTATATTAQPGPTLSSLGSTSSSSASLEAHTERLELLWRCTNSVHEYFACRFASHDVTRPRFIALNASDFVFAAQVSLKLLILRVPGWDAGFVLEKLDFERFVDKVSMEIRSLIERRSQSQWHMEMTARRLIPKMVDPFEKLHCSLLHFKGILFTELTRNAAARQAVMQGQQQQQQQQQEQSSYQQQPVHQQQHTSGEASGTRTLGPHMLNSRPMIAGPMLVDVDLEMSNLDEFNLTQVDLMAYDISTPMWDWGHPGDAAQP
ncbi:unnamed protein product [Parascedosporium putredinis]|uniref:Uncharacterized protein n=1 Tax=Parascedosporium putredinis TaxID=1442378 RepID=A0A9P1GWB7_9PEZI|nr:unnamed protein product [Parascedosporium putredinis]CAI7988612.1 unnamed protein product [Parascedosporium putredinis]